MLRIILLGRTGNNLFQYALGRVLARKHGVPVILDASWFNADGWNEVSHFLNLPLQAKVVRRFSLGARALRKLTGKHYWEYLGAPVLRERTDDQSFDPSFLEAPADCVIFGYFQSPLYFKSIAGELRQELNLLLRGSHASRVSPSASCGRSVESLLAEPSSVAVHVRRGDYLQHPAFQVCGLDYYRRAMNQMRARVPDARFFIFSDDPAWCRSVFTEHDVAAIIGRRICISNSAAPHDHHPDSNNPLHDMHLMSLASHHIIANSTYSWWAAWLGDKPGQQVILPERWYHDGPKAPIEEKKLPHWRVLG